MVSRNSKIYKNKNLNIVDMIPGNLFRLPDEFLYFLEVFCYG